MRKLALLIAAVVLATMLLCGAPITCPEGQKPVYVPAIGWGCMER